MQAPSRTVMNKWSQSGAIKLSIMKSLLGRNWTRFIVFMAHRLENGRCRSRATVRACAKKMRWMLPTAAKPHKGNKGFLENQVNFFFFFLNHEGSKKGSKQNPTVNLSLCTCELCLIILPHSWLIRFQLARNPNDDKSSRKTHDSLSYKPL